MGRRIYLARGYQAALCSQNKVSTLMFLELVIESSGRRVGKRLLSYSIMARPQIQDLAAWQK